MKMRRFVAVTIGAIVLGGLLIAGCGSPVQQIPDGPITVVPGVFQENHTLRWDQSLPVAQRFVVLASFNNQAVRDNETGLVWEKSPQTEEASWEGARFACTNKIIGGRKGWRLPSVHELASLVHPSPGLTLQPGHPFTNVMSAIYWSASSDAVRLNAWVVDFLFGNVGLRIKADDGQVWCVRGPMQESVY